MKSLDLPASHQLERVVETLLGRQQGCNFGAGSGRAVMQMSGPWSRIQVLDAFFTTAVATCFRFTHGIEKGFALPSL